MRGGNGCVRVGVGVSVCVFVWCSEATARVHRSMTSALNQRAIVQFIPLSIPPSDDPSFILNAPCCCCFLRCAGRRGPGRGHPRIQLEGAQPDPDQRRGGLQRECHVGQHDGRGESEQRAGRGDGGVDTGAGDGGAAAVTSSRGWGGMLRARVCVWSLDVCVCVCGDESLECACVAQK